VVANLLKATGVLTPAERDRIVAAARTATV
jgi:hypothetical protein